MTEVLSSDASTGGSNLVRVTVMLPVALVKWLDELRSDSHSSRSSVLRMMIVEARRAAR